jgi:hypothetical protein
VEAEDRNLPAGDPPGATLLSKPLHRSLQFLVDDVRIDHGRGQIRVAEGLLHHADIGSLPVEPGGKGVPERVRAYPIDLLDPGLLGVALHRAAKVGGGHLRALPSRE